MVVSDDVRRRERISSNHERQQLVFDGLDLYAQVFVNGKLAGEAADAFVPAVFDVSRILKAGENELVVRLTAGSELSPDDSPPGQGQTPHKPAFGEIPNPIRDGDLYGHRNWYGRKWLRKPQAEYGWDWQDSLPNIGIWRGVRLEGRSYAVLDDLRLDTLLKDDRVFAGDGGRRREPPPLERARLHFGAVDPSARRRSCALSAGTPSTPCRGEFRSAT